MPSGRHPLRLGLSPVSLEDRCPERQGLAHLDFLGQDSFGKEIVHVAICLGMDSATQGVHCAQELQLVHLELGQRDTQQCPQPSLCLQPPCLPAPRRAQIPDHRSVSSTHPTPSTGRQCPDPSVALQGPNWGAGAVGGPQFHFYRWPGHLTGHVRQLPSQGWHSD